MHYRRSSNATGVAIFMCMTLFAGLEAVGTEVPAKDFDAVRGDRTAGWLPQTRSEVLARNGVVATSQPLAAQAGLQILRQGGNASYGVQGAASGTTSADQPIAGVYRAASDHRKDGEAVGW